MWSTSLLFLLSLLGASASQPFYVDGHQHSHGFASIDDSEYVVKTFLDKMTKTIGSRDTGAISDLFADDFFFKGCKGDYDKNKVVALINKIPAGTAFSFTFKSAKYLNADKIDYSVIITGFGPNPIEAQFLLCAKKGKLSGGSVPACKRSHFHGLITQKRNMAAPQILELLAMQESFKFLNKAKRVIRSKNEISIRKLFANNFTITACDGTYGIDDVLVRAMRIDTEFPFDYSFIGAEYNEDGNLEITAIIYAITDDFTGRFVYSDDKDLVLSGKFVGCDKVPATTPAPFRAFISADQGFVDDSEAVVKSFLAKMTKTIGSKDTGAISDLFADDFFFKGCKGNYDKKKVVALIGSVPTGTVFSFTFKSAKYLSDEKIDYSVIISGFGPIPVEAQFLLCVKTEKLSGGSVPSCQRAHFHGLTISRSFASAPEESNGVINKFLVTLKEAMATRDSSKIGSLFDDNFMFKGCRGTYNKAETVNMITRMPQEPRLDFKLKTSKWNSQGQIEYTVTITGTTDDYDAQFVFCPHRNVLKSGNIVSCPSPSLRKMFADVQNTPFIPRRRLFAAREDSDTIVTMFLTTLKQTLATHDSTAIGTVFDDNFVFKGCLRSYNKADTIAQITHIPQGASFDFTLKASNWNDIGQIEYTVTISGALRDHFDAQFVYCPYRNVLKSGSISSCSSRRMFAKPCIDEFGQFC